LILAQQKQLSQTLKLAANENLPQQAAQEAVGLNKVTREHKQRKIRPWLALNNSQTFVKRDKDCSLSKVKVLDVKILQQVYRRSHGLEILESTRVFDGTGKKELDQNLPSVVELL